MTSSNLAALGEGLGQKSRIALARLDSLRAQEARAAFAEMRSLLRGAQPSQPECAEESVLNYLYVTSLYVDLLESYVDCWFLIVDDKHSASWNRLQDALDKIRWLKGYSTLDTRGFEQQLLQLERAYPHQLFFSIGGVAKCHECSICGRDIDSLDCPHRRGVLYRGEMAVGIVREFEQADHVAVVPHPSNKRCVVQYKDGSSFYKIIIALATLLRGGQPATCFSRLEHSTFRVRDQDVPEQPRNAKCACGSGAKFKRCCRDKLYTERDHVDIVFGKTGVLDLLPDPSQMRLQPPYETPAG